MEYLLRYINENISKKLTLKSVAQYAGYSTWHFCEKFKAYTGVTFMEYLRDRRMQTAVNALLRGEKVTDIAMNCGYDSFGGFEKAFLKTYGCCPSDYERDADIFGARYERRRAQRLPLTDRCHILRETVTMPQKAEDEYIGQYAYHYWKGFLSVPLDKRNNCSVSAAALSAVIRDHRPVIGDGELIVGYNYGADYLLRSERDLMSTILSAPEEAREYLRRGLLSEEQIDELFDFAHDPECRWPYNEQEFPPVADPRYTLLEEELAVVGHCCVDAHIIPGYDRVLTLGFRGLLAYIRDCREKKGTLSPEEAALYDGAETVCEAACGLGRLYADKARELAADCWDDQKKRELLDIAEVCDRVPEHPASTLREAIQSVWFAHIVNTWEDGVNSNSLGRLDQLLYPYYRADIDEGRLTEEEAFELICCFWLKLYRNYDAQQSTVGGCDRNGNDAVNELSYRMLDAVEALDLVRCLSVRYSADTPREFLQRALEVVRHVQKGVPFFFNDDVLIEALTRRGIALEDARNYAMVGCVETCIPGKSNPHASSSRCNVLKALEYALGNGESLMRPGCKPGIPTGDPSEFHTFDALKRAVFDQIVHLIDATVAMTNRETLVRAKEWPQLYKSLLTEGCMETGRSISNEGAVYDYYQVMLLGIPNLADSLAAVRALVYDERRYTMEQLLDQLRRNFPDEEVRREFVNRAPKFGNGNPRADLLAAEITDFCCDTMETRTSALGQGFHAQLYTFFWTIDHGQHTAATPDGRRRGEPLAFNISPMAGQDFRGLAALLQSFTCLPSRKVPGTASAVVDVDPYLFIDKNLDLLTDMLLDASARGLCNVQFNVIDREVLLDAQRHPEKYADLAVAVSGYSQKFVQLHKELQDCIIDRTKHKYL